MLHDIAKHTARLVSPLAARTEGFHADGRSYSKIVEDDSISHLNSYQGGNMQVRFRIACCSHLSDAC